MIDFVSNSISFHAFFQTAVFHVSTIFLHVLLLLLYASMSGHMIAFLIMYLLPLNAFKSPALRPEPNFLANEAAGGSPTPTSCGSFAVESLTLNISFVSDSGREAPCLFLVVAPQHHVTGGMQFRWTFHYVNFHLLN